MKARRWGHTSGEVIGAFLRAGGGSWVLEAGGHWSSQLAVGKTMQRAKGMPRDGPDVISILERSQWLWCGD